jgi:uncharacterized protein
VTSLDIQAGGTNHHYGRIAHWLAGNLWRRFADLTVNIKVGTAFRDLTAVADGLAQVGVYTPAVSARLCLDGRSVFERPRPNLRAIGVVPHRDALVAGVAAELGLSSVDDIAERKLPLRLGVPLESQLTGHASRHVLALHGITREALESWGGQWIDTPSAQIAWKLVASGEANAMINESLPQAFRPLARARPIRLLSMRQSALEELESTLGYRWVSVPAGTIAGQDEPVLGLRWEHWIVVAHADLPDDIAYTLADAFFGDANHLERQYTLDGRVPVSESSLEVPMRPEVVANEVTIPLHPGARRRYEEAGVLR